ncbi:hypothetical protein AAHC03_026062 [Spirometra sp. Aus1]
MELQQQSKSKDMSSGRSQKTNEYSEHEAFLRQLHNQSGSHGFLLEYEPGNILDDNWDPALVEDATQSAEERHKDLVQPHEVNLEGVPVIISQPKKVYYAWEGRPAVFECVAEPVSHVVVLCADKKFPFMAPGTSDRLRVIQLDSANRPTPGGSRWHIQLKVRAKDVEEWFGAYECTCEVWNQIPALKRVKKVFSENATIKEAYLEREFQLEPIPEQLTVGQRLLLSCQPPRGKPTPNLYWLKDGVRVNRTIFPHIVINDYNQLIIEQVTAGDFGNYTCVADTLGVEKRYASAQVTEIEAVKEHPNQRNIQGLWSPWGRCELDGQGQRRCQQTRFKMCTNGTSNGHLSQYDPNSTGGLVRQSELLLQREALRSPSPCEPRVVETRECPPDHCSQLPNGLHGKVPMESVSNRIGLREIAFYIGLAAVFFVLLIATHIIVRLIRKKTILRSGFSLRRHAGRSNEYGKRNISGKVAGTTFNLMPTLSSNACGIQFNSPTRGTSTDSTAKASDSAGLLNTTQKTVLYPLPPPPPSTNGFGVTSDFRVTNSDASITGSTYSQPMFHRADLNGVSLMNSYTSQNLPSSPHKSTFDSAFGGSIFPLLLSNAASSTPIDGHAPPLPLPPPNQMHHFPEEAFTGPGMVLRSPPPSVSTAPFGGMGLSPHGHTDALYLSTPTTSSLSSESVFYNEIAPSGKSLMGSTLEGMPENSELGTVTWSTVTALGGRISIPDTGIYLYIPAGALPPGISREIYLAVCRDQKFLPNLTDNQTLLGPVIQFGPPGLPLLKPLILTFPHCAQVSQGNWSFSIHCFCNPHVCNSPAAAAGTSNSLSSTNSQSAGSTSIGAGPAVVDWIWQEIVTIGQDSTLTPGHPQCHIDGQQVHMITQTPMRFCLIGQLAGQQMAKATAGRMTTSTDACSENNSGSSMTTVTTTTTANETLPMASSRHSQAPLTKNLALVAFATLPPSSSAMDCSLRIYAVLDTPDAVRHVRDTERRLGGGGRMLLQPKQIQFRSDAGGLVFSIQDLSPSWRSRLSTQSIPFCHIWGGNRNALLHCAFTLERVGTSPDPNVGFECVLECRQEDCQGARQLLNLKITPNECKIPENKFAGDKVSLDGSHGSYPCIPPHISLRLCSILDPTSSAGNDWRQLAQRLGMESLVPYFGTLSRPTEMILTLWEAANAERLPASLTDLRATFYAMQRPDCAALLPESPTRTAMR